MDGRRWRCDGTHGCRVTVLFCSVQDVVTYLHSPVYVYSEIRIRITAVQTSSGWLAEVIRFGFGFGFGFTFALGGPVGLLQYIHTYARTHTPSLF